MTKENMIKELYKAIHKSRWEHGFYFGKSQMDGLMENQKICYEHNMLVVEAEERVLTELADKMECSPVLKDWYLQVFDEGEKALSLNEYSVPDELK